MSNLEEVETALAVLAYGFADNPKPNRLNDCYEFYKTDEAKEIIKNNITVLHCTTEYPSPYEDINLRAMKTIKDKFGVKVGLSDHSKRNHIPVAAVAMGAELIEKHFTLDRDMKGPDHMASLEPNELKEMISQIRDIEKALGDAKKEPKASEIKNINVARRSLVAKENIKKGETYTADNIMCKRPGGGVSAIKYWDYLGKKAPSDIIKDEFVK
jgi:N-acetylneuraminate synthase